EVPLPQPGPGQVRLRVRACGLNPVDWKVARGGHASWTWPHVLGLDIAGVIDAFGPGAAELRPCPAPERRLSRPWTASI
ncbi:MAG: Oxidoreductase, partial [Actinomyces urogenitalis DORA_12]